MNVWYDESVAVRNERVIGVFSFPFFVHACQFVQNRTYFELFFVHYL